jgi:hypothetical protein
MSFKLDSDVIKKFNHWILFQYLLKNIGHVSVSDMISDLILNFEVLGFSSLWPMHSCMREYWSFIEVSFCDMLIMNESSIQIHLYGYSSLSIQFNETLPRSRSPTSHIVMVPRLLVYICILANSSWAKFWDEIQTHLT